MPRRTLGGFPQVWALGIALAFTQCCTALQATVDHTVDQLVPVDGDSLMLIALILLELPADEVPVTGTKPRPRVPGEERYSSSEPWIANCSSSASCASITLNVSRTPASVNSRSTVSSVFGA